MSRLSRDEAAQHLTRTIRAYQASTDALDEITARMMGVNRTDSRCWDLIDQHGPITAGELARRAALTTGAVTGVLDRLESKGIIRRRRDEQDRRKVYAEVTEEARRRAWEMYGPMADKGRRVFEGFTVAEIDRIAQFLRLATEITDERAAELRAQLEP
jgi:DNA-binding MarR family transcriptional regulator